MLPETFFSHLTALRTPCFTDGDVQSSTLFILSFQEHHGFNSVLLLLYPYDPAPCWAHSTCSIDIIWINKWMRYIFLNSSGPCICFATLLLLLLLLEGTLINVMARVTYTTHVDSASNWKRSHICIQSMFLSRII